MKTMMMVMMKKSYAFALAPSRIEVTPEQSADYKICLLGAEMGSSFHGWVQLAPKTVIKMLYSAILTRPEP